MSNLNVVTLVGNVGNTPEQREFESKLTLAWHIEAFSRQKRLPSLEKILKDARRKPRKKSGSRSDAILKAMAAEQGVIID